MGIKRIIPCLDVKVGRVVKGIKFGDLRDAGDPVDMAVEDVYKRQGYRRKWRNSWQYCPGKRSPPVHWTTAAQQWWWTACRML